MKLAALLLVFSLFILLTSSTQAANSANITNAVSARANGTDSSVTVDISNNVNTGNNSTSYTSEGTTTVDISQSGNGTSRVVINGKEWLLEGPGEIHVDENSDSNTEATPSLTPPTSETPTPTPAVLGTTDDNANTPVTLSDKIQKRFEMFKKSILDLLKNFLGGF